MFLLPVQMVGCSHQTSDPQAVGRARLSAAGVETALHSLTASGTAAVLLSTCHRTELYWSGDADLLPWFEEHVTSRSATPVHVERREADLAVRHLFSVASGMCSARFGEPEILRQVRTAWITAQSADASDPLLDTVFRRAVEAARHIRLAIGADADPSLGARVRDEVLARGSRADGRLLDVLLVGAGDAARGVLETLTEASLRSRVRVSLTSRSDDRAARLASAFGASVVPWQMRDAQITSADAVVFAVQSSTPLIDAAAARRLMALRESKALWIDLGVPVSVDPHALPATVELMTLETLAPHSRRDVARDRRALMALQRELARFAADTQRRRIGSNILALEARASVVARATVKAAANGAWSADAADAVARRVTRALLREIAELSA